MQSHLFAIISAKPYCHIKIFPMSNNTISEIKEIVENSLKYSEASYKDNTGKSFTQFFANFLFLGSSFIVQNWKIIPRTSTCPETNHISKSPKLFQKILFFSGSRSQALKSSLKSHQMTTFSNSKWGLRKLFPKICEIFEFATQHAEGGSE